MVSWLYSKKRICFLVVVLVTIITVVFHFITNIDVNNLVPFVHHSRPCLWPWIKVTSHTTVWQVAHYDHRPFAYGGSAIVIIMFHDHSVKVPELYLKTNTIGCLEAKAKWIEFGKLEKVPNEEDYCYLAVFNLPKDKNVPNEVQLSNASDCSVPVSDNMPVYYKEKETEIDFATCLYKGVTINSSILEKTTDLASWIEINRAVGVSHITIYNQDIPTVTLNMLRYYVEQGFVDLIDWHIDNPVNRIGNNGQIGSTMDCLYRYLRRSKYILFLDMDELIIPHNTNSLFDMMKLIGNEKVTQYRFYNSFWHDVGKIVNNGSENNLDNIDFETLPIHFKRTNRTKNCESTSRYKNIIKTEGAIRVGIHKVYKMKKGQIRFQVPVHVGLMHHYRTPDYAIDEEQIEDMIMSQYVDKVKSRLSKICTSLL